MDRSDCVLRSGWQFRKSVFWARAGRWGDSYGWDRNHLDQERGAECTIECEAFGSHSRFGDLRRSIRDWYGYLAGRRTNSGKSYSRTCGAARLERSISEGSGAARSTGTAVESGEGFGNCGAYNRAGTIMNSWPALGAEDWKDDTYLWRSRGVGIGESSEIADEDITNVAGALSRDVVTS